MKNNPPGSVMNRIRRLICRHLDHRPYRGHPSGAILCLRCKQVWR